jgi:hypothetical protein
VGHIKLLTIRQKQRDELRRVPEGSRVRTVSDDLRKVHGEKVGVAEERQGDRDHPILHAEFAGKVEQPVDGRLGARRVRQPRAAASRRTCDSACSMICARESRLCGSPAVTVGSSLITGFINKT